ncbi:hypothetical protein IWQ61_009995, partial [Dispira simplex]
MMAATLERQSNFPYVFTDVITEEQLEDYRSLQRTVNGSLWRTSAGLLTAGFVIFKVFSEELYVIGLLLIFYSACVTAAGIVRKHTTPSRIYELSHYPTGGNLVVFLTFTGLITW